MLCYYSPGKIEEAVKILGEYGLQTCVFNGHWGACTQQPLRSVKVILTRIKVLDDKDGCLTGAGELAFDVIVAPNSNPNRAVRKRLPGRGYYALNDGDTVEPKEVIFEGWVEQGATLDISMGGNEFDWFLFWERREHLARYRRILQGDIDCWAGDYRPDDEKNDPELGGCPK